MMLNKHTLLVCLLLIAGLYPADGAKRRILFIGNSYTAVNDLPGTLNLLAQSLGDTLEYDSNTPGGATFNVHSTDATTLAKIQLGNWDYVVLQAQSQEPSFDPTQVATDTYPYAKKLDSLIHVYNPCAETIFYMTWGRKNGDASNCAFYPPICTYEGMQQRLRESYLEMSDMNNATCAPVGVAWKKVRTSFPGIELYQADESHPTIHGTYLAACVFYSTIFHKESNGAPYQPTGILNWELLSMQNAASRTVLDSLENWQQHGQLPFAKYNKTNIFNQFSFTNQSLRATTYSWDFGDGSPLNTQNSPNHTYATPGNYVVKLTASNACGKKDVYTDTAKVGSVLSTPEIASEEAVHVYSDAHSLHVSLKNSAGPLSLFDLGGHRVAHWEDVSNAGTYPLPALAPGLYSYSLHDAKGKRYAGKVIIR